MPSSTSGLAAWRTFLARAQTAFDRGAFNEAQRGAEALLKEPLPRDMRGQALLVAADAAYGGRAYPAAAQHYGQFISEQKDSPESGRALMTLGWSRLRSGDRDGARAAWTALADTRSADPRAPLALALSAELANQAGHPAESERLLDRLIARYPSIVVAGTARMGRAVSLLRRQQEAAALRDLEQVIRVSGPSVLNERRKLAEALASVDGEKSLEPLLRVTGGPPLEGNGTVDRFAARLLEKPQRHHEVTPHLLHGVVLIVARRGWADPLTGTLAGRLVEDFPSYPAGPQLLARVADAAAAAGQWPLARHCWETMLAHAPSALGHRERLLLAEALLRTGEHARGRKHLEEIAGGGGEEAPRALLMLAQMHMTSGDRAAALAAYDRIEKDFPRFPRSASSLLTHARLLDDLGQRARARGVLQKVLEVGKGEVAAEAAYRLGRSLSADGRHQPAVEWYLTAAYLAERSTWARQALLGAGHSFATLNEPRQALAAYWKLVAPRPGTDQPDDREVSGEAAYRAAEILYRFDLHSEALDMYQTSARLSAGLPAERRALLAALQCVAGAGVQQTAEAIYQRLQKAGATEAELAQARQVLRANGRVGPRESGPASALPKAAR